MRPIWSMKYKNSLLYKVRKIWPSLNLEGMVPSNLKNVKSHMYYCIMYTPLSLNHYTVWSVKCLVCTYVYKQEGRSPTPLTTSILSPPLPAARNHGYKIYLECLPRCTGPWDPPPDPTQHSPPSCSRYLDRDISEVNYRLRVDTQF